MEIDKSVSLNASASRVWALLLDPQAMGACVPGMESIEVLTPEEYKAVMKVKIAFISARFTLRTRIVERREPLYLKAEGVGEDAAVASSLKYVTEIHLNERPDGGTDLHIHPLGLPPRKARVQKMVKYTLGLHKQMVHQSLVWRKSRRPQRSLLK
jgi:carbon monoxide dehydrogenase subunit G